LTGSLFTGVRGKPRRNVWDALRDQTWPRTASYGMLSILRHGTGSPRAEGAQDEERIAPSEARRADRRVGADRASLRLAGAARIRAHPSAGAVLRSRLRSRGGDQRGLRTHAAAEKAAAGRVSPRATAVSASVLSLALFLPLGLYQAIGLDFSSVGFVGWASVVHYGAFVTALGYLLWFGGLAKVPASTAGVFTGVLPVSAVLLCYLVLGEPFSWAHQVVAQGIEVSLIPERRREGLEGLPRAGRVVVIISEMCRKGALDRGRADSGCAGR
jgi:hypothetical protein